MGALPFHTGIAKHDCLNACFIKITMISATTITAGSYMIYKPKTHSEVCGYRWSHKGY